MSFSYLIHKIKNESSHHQLLQTKVFDMRKISVVEFEHCFNAWCGRPSTKVVQRRRMNKQTSDIFLWDTLPHLKQSVFQVYDAYKPGV